MNRLLSGIKQALMAVCVMVAPSAVAQEVVTLPSASAASSVTEDALRKQLSAMTELVRSMEEQIKRCTQQQGVTCPAVAGSKPVADPRQVGRAAFQQEVNKGAGISEPDAHAESDPVSLSPAAPRAATPRYGAGFRTAPEERLTCDDYSESYFKRHPSMAKVCNAKVAEPQPVIEMPALPPMQ